MSESCRRGYKCMCFQCGEKDCEKYESKPPKWIEQLQEDKLLWKELEKIARGKGKKNEDD